VQGLRTQVRRMHRLGAPAAILLPDNPQKAAATAATAAAAARTAAAASMGAPSRCHSAKLLDVSGGSVTGLRRCHPVAGGVATEKGAAVFSPCTQSAPDSIHLCASVAGPAVAPATAGRTDCTAEAAASCACRAGAGRGGWASGTCTCMPAGISHSQLAASPELLSTELAALRAARHEYACRVVEGDQLRNVLLSSLGGTLQQQQVRAGAHCEAPAEPVETLTFEGPNALLTCVSCTRADFIP
jgi:hypothetical protein